MARFHISVFNIKQMLPGLFALSSKGMKFGLERMRQGLELLDNPNAEKLMEIAAAAGLANNFGALRTLITKGIQWGHMKMHLSNILNSFDATEDEKRQVLEHFKTEKVSFNSASTVIKELRN